MVAPLKHEDFYTTGTYFVPEMGVYAGWIALENSFAANQVFFNEQRDIAILFSGECFIDPQTLIELRDAGHDLGNEDANWLVHLYEREGNDFFGKLNGLFSGLLIDKKCGKAFLFNDRYGVDRIYCHETKNSIYFASEAKALLRILPELRRLDDEGLAQFLALGCTLEGRSLFRSIQLLPGGSVWAFDHGKCVKRKYFSPEVWESQPVLSGDDFESAFQETFSRVVPRYFESDSRIGISLTGGLDTRMVMACRPKTPLNSICYTFGPEKGDTLDVSLGARVAEACGFEHRTIRVGSDFFSDFASHADRTVYGTDGCFGISGAHEIYMNAQARRLASVRLTGNFGGEVLRGISTFKPVGLSARLFSQELARAVGCSLEQLGDCREQPTTFGAFREVPWNLFGSLIAGRSQVSFRTPYLDNEIVRLAYQAPENLRRSRGPGLRLVKQNSPNLATIPTDKGDLGKSEGLSAVLRRAFSKVTFKLDYMYNEGLPHWLSPLDPLFRHCASETKVFGLHKHLHYRSWFRRELAEYINSVLTDGRVQRSSFWNSAFVRKMGEEHVRGCKNYVLEINAVLTLEAIERLLFQELPRGTETLDSAVSPVPTGIVRS